MSKVATDDYLAENEYYLLEEESEIRHEYMDGELFTMAGATRKHNLISSNISTELSLKLRETDCELYAGDFLVNLRAGHDVYPDIAVACGEIETNENETVLFNPVVVFEVLSKSTEQRDRGDKAEDYFKLKSLKDYVLVSQKRIRVEHFSKQKNNVWTLKIYEKLDDIVDLKSLNCEISIELIYLKLKLPPMSLVEEKSQSAKKR